MQARGLMGHFFYRKNGNPSPKLLAGAGDQDNRFNGTKNNVREIRPRELPAGLRDNRTSGDRTNESRLYNKHNVYINIPIF